MEQDIDRKAFILGMITAFAECVANECKKLAFSPPFYPDDYEVIIREAERIAGEQGIYLWYERNPDLPDTHRVQWLVLYKFPEVLDEYKALREQGFNPVWDLEAFYPLLSYGIVWGENAEKVIPKYREEKETACTFARVLLKPEDWPVPRGKGSPLG